MKYLSFLTGGGVTVLVASLLVFYIIAGEWNGLPYESHKFVITGSTPVLQRLIFHPEEILTERRK